MQMGCKEKNRFIDHLLRESWILNVVFQMLLLLYFYYLTLLQIQVQQRNTKSDAYQCRNEERWTDAEEKTERESSENGKWWQ